MSTGKYLARCKPIHGCQLWTGPVDENGIPKAEYMGQSVSLRRLMYALYRGEKREDLPQDMKCVPTCRNQACLSFDCLTLVPRFKKMPPVKYYRVRSVFELAGAL